MPAPTSFSPAITNQIYHPDGTGHPNQKLNVFLPSGPKRPGGSALVLDFNLSNFVNTSRATTITKDTNWFAYNALLRGIAVASVSMTIVNQTDSAGAIISGRGTNKAPWYSDGNGNPFHGTFTDGATTLTYGQSMAIKDSMWATQMIHRMIEDGTLRSVNHDLIAARGSSSGGFAACWAHFMPDQQGESGFFASGRTRPFAVMVRSPLASWKAYANTTLLQQFPFYSDPTPFNLTNPSTAGNTLANQIGGSNVVKKIDDGSVTRHNAEMCSLLYLMAKQDVAAGYKGIQDQTAKKTLIWMWTDDPENGAIESTNFNDGAAYNTSYTQNYTGNYITNTLTFAHSAWNACTLKHELEELGVQFASAGKNSRMVLPQYLKEVVTGSTVDKVVFGEQGFQEDQLEWLEGLIA
jgi:hypothetical protein